MHRPHEQPLTDKLEPLPPERMAEAEDSVDLPHNRDDTRGLIRAAVKDSETTFAKIWDNEDDVTYDRLWFRRPGP